MSKQIRIPVNKTNWADKPNKKLVEHHSIDILGTYNKYTRDIEIRLSSKPYVDIDLQLISDIGLSTDSVSFTTDNWHNTQTINVLSRDAGSVLMSGGEILSENLLLQIPDGAWNPDIADSITALWVDADDENTITTNGNRVTQLSDKSGNNRHATQTDNNSRPRTGIETIGGLNCLSFDGINDYLGTENANWLNGTQFSIIAVTNPDYDFLNYFCGVFGSSGPGEHMYCGWDTSSVWRIANGITSSNMADFSATYDGNDELSVTSYLSPGSAAWLNGTSIGTSPNPSVDMNSSAPFVIGETYGPYYPFWGSIGELIVTIGELDNTTRQKFEGYLAHKWSLESKLPPGHPYKSEKPYV